MVEDPQIYQLAYRLFLEEVPGLLETIERELLDLENNSERALKVNNLMRAVHTIKGGAANVQLEVIEGIAHRLEDVLRGLYSPDLTIDSSLKSLLFDSYEYLELLLSAKVENTNINER
ncbi:MAG: Hpt domain-containing protein, partial [Prochloraceae cyanobacterium]